MKIDIAGYRLDPTKKRAGPSLNERLAEVRSIEHGPFSTVSEVQAYLVGRATHESDAC